MEVKILIAAAFIGAIALAVVIFDTLLDAVDDEFTGSWEGDEDVDRKDNSRM